MESYNSLNTSINQQFVKDLMEFGFSEEETKLALKITNNNKEAAAELIMSGGANLESL